MALPTRRQRALWRLDRARSDLRLAEASLSDSERNANEDVLRYSTTTDMREYHSLLRRRIRQARARLARAEAALHRNDLPAPPPDRLGPDCHPAPSRGPADD